jgi:hypothetical protein
LLQESTIIVARVGVRVKRKIKGENMKNETKISKVRQMIAREILFGNHSNANEMWKAYQRAFCGAVA